jgi:hypothetical protein
MDTSRGCVPWWKTNGGGVQASGVEVAEEGTEVMALKALG